MRRVITFFQWQVADWKRIAQEFELLLPTSREVVGTLAAADVDAQNKVRKGKIAYAYQQGNTRELMKRCCETKWRILHSKLLQMEDGDATNMIEYPPDM